MVNEKNYIEPNQLHPNTGEFNVVQTLWHRDISAVNSHFFYIHADNRNLSLIDTFDNTFLDSSITARSTDLYDVE